MLTREHSIVNYENGLAVPDCLTRQTHRQYAAYAQRMCQVYREGIGQTRRELHRQIREILANEVDCPLRRVDAFCKLLDDAAEFQRDSAGQASKLRRTIFQTAARMHPLVREPDVLFEHQEQYVKDSIATSLGKSWAEIDGQLFGDLIEFQTLIRFDAFEDPVRLLARYNIAQVQAAMYDATRMTVWATESYKSILRYAKLARLMHRIERTNDGYRVELDGPASLLQSTHRYGIAMAKFLPGLLACRGWRMRATLKPWRWPGQVILELDCHSGLSSDVVCDDEFDSKVEEAFFQSWTATPRQGWTLRREVEILQHGQTCFLPDFTFEHVDGRRVLMEIVGFWTPEYLQHKQAVLETFSKYPILLAVSEKAKHQFPLARHRVLVYKKAISVDDVMKMLNS